MRILFTSASSPAALALARVLAAEGHILHGADEEYVWGTSPARYSRAYQNFYRLTGSRSVAELWKAIGDHIDLVIPFRSLPGQIVESLKSRGANIVGENLAHNDYEFQDFVRDNVIDASSESPSIVRVPASFTVHSRTCIAEILSNRDSTFSLQPLPCYDTDDEDTLVDVGNPSSSSSEPLILSCSTLDDLTVEAIKRLPISDTNPYRLIEVAEGGSFYSAHAFVHAGRIRTFTVTNARATDQDFVIAAANQPLYGVLYKSTERLLGALENWQTAVANHLNLTFHVHDTVEYSEFVRKVTIISCHNDPHPSIVLLASIPALRRKLALAYTSPSLSGVDQEPVQFPVDASSPKAIYSAPWAVREFARIMLVARPWRRDWWARLAYITMMCWVWAINFKEETWDPKDPGPTLCLWSVMFIASVVANVGRPRGIRWMTRQLANIRSSWLATQIVVPMVSTVLAIARYWLAILVDPLASGRNMLLVRRHRSLSKS
ncbi:hypothetical protein BU23DRAFT_598597 [Bimuria novae-zelandiae CBS 107.79]|uniref:Uncharacterized protein n=1 Tax=Bimuria novae-zelandiae CBS 107.79 TaxID=1447943 RepID=A0A6A5VA53_9PLEO|nr:hypothetical protein BU23DRAFT_598597 [Bimuria novae-zelandiae CBS 107.79]